MRNAGGLAIADTDEYFASFFAATGGEFEHDHLREAMAQCAAFNVAVDGGAHVGSWSRTMAEHFGTVLAFEPVAKNYECLRQNVPDNVVTFPCGLAATFSLGSINYEQPANGGAGFVGEGSDFVLTALDALNLGGVDLLKLDVEGFELQALRGAALTIARCRPVVMVEQNSQAERYGIPLDAAGRWLESQGYTLHKRMNKDYIYVP